MIRFHLSLVLLAIAAHSARADLVVDSSQSSTTISVSGVGDTSQTSGTIELATTPLSSPFDTAQIFEMELVLDEALDIGIGLASASSNAGEVNIQLVTPGAAGDVVAGEFDQLGNVVESSGVMTIVDPFNLIGGSRDINLNTFGSQTVDFNDVSISAVGDIVTIDATYSFTDTIEGLDVTVSGRIVASGFVSVPEPSSIALLGTVSVLVLVRRRR